MMNTECYMDKIIDDCLTDKSTTSLRCRRWNPDVDDAPAIVHFISNHNNYFIRTSKSSPSSLPSSGHHHSTRIESSSKLLSPYPPKTYVILLEEHKEEINNDVIKGVVIWYIGYSTWKGKVMNLDTICTSASDGDNNFHHVNHNTDTSSDSSYEKILINVIVKIAQRLEFNRIVYQVRYNVYILNE